MFRPLFSSLLEAILKKTWDLRDDMHESKEADYIIEVEGNLLYTKRQMLMHLFQYFLQTKSNLSKDKISKVSIKNLWLFKKWYLCNVMQINETFNVKVNIFQKTLQDNLKSELENMALKYGGDKIVR